MTEAARKYFELYYKLERMIDDEKSHTPEADDLRDQLDEVYYKMTDGERELLDIVGKNNIKEIVWTIQRQDNNYFNYHNNYTANFTYTESTKILKNALIAWNSFERIESKDADFFNYVQPYQHHSKIPKIGIYCYSFALFPEKVQPSGSFNASALEKVELKLHINDNYNNDYLNNKLFLKGINPLNKLNYKVTVYSIATNIFEVNNGSGGMKFT
jgi:hypothetical protein